MPRILIVGGGVGGRLSSQLALALAMAGVQQLVPADVPQQQLSDQFIRSNKGWHSSYAQSQPWYRRQRNGRPARY